MRARALLLLLLPLAGALRLLGEEAQQLARGEPPRRRPRLLFFLPGIGCKDPARAANVRRSVEHVLSFQRSGELEVKCLVHSFVARKAWRSFDPELLHFLEGSCSLRFLPGLLYADHVKSLHPDVLASADYDFLFLSLDDVVLAKGKFPALDLAAAVEAARNFGLDVASPRVEGAYWRPTKYEAKKEQHAELAQPNVTGMYAEFVEVFSVLFTPRGWSCYWDNTDPLRFGNGWGADSFFPSCRREYPRFKIGLLGREVVSHAAGMQRRCQEVLEHYVEPGFRKAIDKEYYASLHIVEKMKRLETEGSGFF